MTSQATGSISTLGDFFEDARNLDLNGFIERHGNAFFLHHGPFGDIEEADGRDKTLAREPQPESGSSFNPQSDFLVFSIRPGRDPQNRQPIRVGRGETGDLVIPDASISHVHAHLITDAKGHFSLLDALSMNGSRINDKPVPTKGNGDPVPLHSGDRVSLGSLNLTFLEAPEFRTLILRLTGW